MSVISRRVHELDTAPAIRRHFAQALDNGAPRYQRRGLHTMATGWDVRVFVSEVSREVVAAIDAAGGEITGVSTGEHTLAVRVREVIG